VISDGQVQVIEEEGHSVGGLDFVKLQQPILCLFTRRGSTLHLLHVLDHLVNEFEPLVLIVLCDKEVHDTISHYIVHDAESEEERLKLLV